MIIHLHHYLDHQIIHKDIHSTMTTSNMVSNNNSMDTDNRKGMVLQAYNYNMFPEDVL